MNTGVRLSRHNCPIISRPLCTEKPPLIYNNVYVYILVVGGVKQASHSFILLSGFKNRGISSTLATKCRWSLGVNVNGCGSVCACACRRGGDIFNPRNSVVWVVCVNTHTHTHTHTRTHTHTHTLWQSPRTHSSILRDFCRQIPSARHWHSGTQSWTTLKTRSGQ